MSEEIGPSFTELGLKAKRAMVMGMGGGGDVVLTIPIANQLRILGVETVYVGGVSNQWWTETGEPFSGGGINIVGSTVFDVAELTDSTLWAPMIAGVEKTSHVSGRYPPESILKDILPGEAFLAGLTDGVAGLRDSLNQVIAERGIDLFVGVDFGCHCFHDGNEVGPTHTSLVGFMSLGALTQLNCPLIYGLGAYGLDAEMELEELDERVAKVMKAGGYLGAYGITRKDVRDLQRAWEMYRDPVEQLVLFACQGGIGLHHIPVDTPWGRRVRVTPIAASILFFDPDVIVREVSTCVEELKNTRSLGEAEQIYEQVLGEIPDTKMKYVIDYMRKD